MRPGHGEKELRQKEESRSEEQKIDESIRQESSSGLREHRGKHFGW